MLFIMTYLTSYNETEVKSPPPVSPLDVEAYTADTKKTLENQIKYHTERGTLPELHSYVDWKLGVLEESKRKDIFKEAWNNYLREIF